jgi:catalase
MVASRFFAVLAACGHVAYAQCPLMTGNIEARELPTDHPPVRRDNSKATATDEFMSQFEINDNDVYMTSDVGGPISDQESLSAGERGPTLLEDFIFRQKVSSSYPILNNNC